MDKPTVLIIDDHQLIREMWTKVLEDSGQVTVLKYSGRLKETLDIIQQVKPTVILLDVHMTPMSGFELLPVIKQQSPSSHVIGFSVHTNAKYAQQMLQLGASGYVTKNAEIAEVLTAISEVANGNIYLNSEIKTSLAAIKN